MNNNNHNMFVYLTLQKTVLLTLNMGIRNTLFQKNQIPVAD